MNLNKKYINYCILLSGFSLLLIFSCSRKSHNELHILDSKYAEYIQIFEEIDSLLKIDNSIFWKKELYGPILIVNPETRELVANFNHSDSIFTKSASVFIGTLPENINIANTAINWGNNRWTMIMEPLPENIDNRNNLIIHELFHRVQPQIGFDSLHEENNIHLDTYQGRVLLKLELEALKNSLKNLNNNSFHNHLENALYFRSIRQNEIHKKIMENSLEINEGLAEFTGVMLSGRNEKEIISYFTEGINNFYKNKTFVRSFAYYTTPIYGFLLSKSKPNWQHNINKATILTDFFIDEFSIRKIKHSNYIKIAKANNYNYTKIEEEERKRELLQEQQLKMYKNKFTENPVLEIPLKNMNISFDPRNIIPLENYGTIYTTLRLTDDWGTLVVEKGALINSTWSNVTISEPIKVSLDEAEGNGWKLNLNKNWKIIIDKNSYKLSKKH